MAIDSKKLQKNISNKDLLKSIQELSLTLKLLKTLASDLKHKSEIATGSHSPEGNPPPHSTTNPESTTLTYKNLH